MWFQRFSCSAPSPQEAANKALSSLSKLGTQTFALSPFSQYFDDWLVNLRNVLSEFESNPAISEDDQFIKDRSQIFLNAERELAVQLLEGVGVVQLFALSTRVEPEQDVILLPAVGVNALNPSSRR